jgi:hypothetical protein
MKFIATVSDPHQTYNVHLELGDDDTARARVADALTEIQQRFLPRSEQRKPAPRPAATRPTTSGGEVNREK